jgi:hypothetical protein
MAKRRSAWKTLLIWCGTPVFIVLAAYWIEHWRGEREWEKYRESAKARGVKLDFEDFISPPVPEAENFAAIPLFDSIFAAKDTLPDANPFSMAVNSVYLRRAGDPVPKPLDLTKWRDRFLREKYIHSASSDPARDVLLALERYTPALEELRRASTRPQCRYPVSWEKGIEVNRPHLGTLQNATLVLSLRMKANLALGDSAAAMEDWHLGLRLHRSLEREPTLISGFIRNAIFEILADSLRQGFAARRWFAADIRTIEADLATIHVLDIYRFCLASERASFNRFDDDFATGRYGWFGQWHGPDTMKFFASLYPSGWVRAGQLTRNQFVDALLDRFNTDDREVFRNPASEIAPRYIFKNSPYDRARFSLGNTRVSMLEREERSFFHCYSVVAQARIACALELYRQHRGEFPALLDALETTYLSPLPLDPCTTGGTMRFERTEAGYRLWSCGENRKNDGGVIDPSIPSSALRQLDWIWEIP